MYVYREDKQKAPNINDVYSMVFKYRQYFFPLTGTDTTIRLEQKNKEEMASDKFKNLPTDP